MSDQPVTPATPPGGGAASTPPASGAAGRPGLSRLERSLIPEESVEEFRRFRLGMHEDLRPRGVFESTLVERYVILQWRMQRYAVMEAQQIASRQENATAWSNPRRQKSTPTAGVVWADDQQYYGGSLEKLTKQEYRLSLEATRILRELTKHQKARAEEEEAGTAYPHISQFDTHRPRRGDTRMGPSMSSEPSVDAGASSHTTDPRNKSENLQNELSPSAKSPKPTRNEAKPIAQRVHPPTNEAKPMWGRETRGRYDTDDLRAEIERRINRHLSRPAATSDLARQGVDSRLKATQVGSG